MPYQCPHCEEEITELTYECDRTEYHTEWGNYLLSADDYEFRDSDYNDTETENYRHRCPECEESLEPSEVLRTGEEEEENIPDTSRIKQLAIFRCPHCQQDWPHLDDNQQCPACHKATAAVLVSAREFAQVLKEKGGSYAGLD